VIWALFTLYEFESEIFSKKIYITLQHAYMHDFFDTDDKLHITRTWGWFLRRLRRLRKLIRDKTAALSFPSSRPIPAFGGSHWH